MVMQQTDRRKQADLMGFEKFEFGKWMCESQKLE
jgi:hypothetical protein